VREMWRADHLAFVDGLGDGQVLGLSPRCDQHAALRTTRFCDDVVPRIDLVHKLERLAAGEHTYLHIEGTKQLHYCGGLLSQ
jgi:hypothetical protein